MALRKYQKVEKTEVLPPEAQDRISAGLNKVGKASVRDLTDEERKQLLDKNRI